MTNSELADEIEAELTLYDGNGRHLLWLLAQAVLRLLKYP